MPEAAPPTLAERVLAHLRAFPVPDGAMDVPREVTQDGIADALGAQVAHVSRALKKLTTDGLVAARLAHPRGSKRRSRAYTLTDAGRAAAATARLGAPAPARALPPRELSRGVHVYAGVAPPGRDRELAALVAAFQDAVAHGPRVALLEADAGMGKSRLLAAFGAACAARGARVLSGRAVPVGGEQLVGPLLGALEPIGFEERYRARAAGTPHERAVAAAVEALTAAARASPVVVLADDLHHAGPAAADVLRGVATALPSPTPILIVAAFRREEAWELPNGPLYTALTPLREVDGAIHLALGPLDRAGVAALLADAGAKLSAPLVDRVAAESGGNPLYALAMAEALADGVDESDFLPLTVQNAVRERFGALPPDALGVLQLAAVAGPEVDYAVLERAYAGSEDALIASLDALLDKLLLEETGDKDRLRVRFTHPKVRETVLADLTAPRRRWCEARVAAL